jgi:hypothetical protein
MHAGHYVHARKTNPVSYREENINCQCPGCNTFAHGRLDRYAVYLEKKYGYGILQELVAQKNTVYRLDSEWYEEKMVELEQKIAVLEG